MTDEMLPFPNQREPRDQRQPDDRSYDISAIRVDRRALTIRAAHDILNRPLSPLVVAELVQQAAGDIVATLPIRLLADVYKHVIPQLLTADDEITAQVARYTPNVDQITVGQYHELLRDTAQGIALPTVAVDILRTAYGDDILDQPYAAAAPLLKKVFDQIEQGGN